MGSTYKDRIKKYGLVNIIIGLFHTHIYSILIWRDATTTYATFVECSKCGKRKEYGKCI